MDEDGEDLEGSLGDRLWDVVWKLRALVVVLAVLVAWWMFRAVQDRASDSADKRYCERAYGAGLCVHSDGRWVPVGSRS